MIIFAYGRVSTKEQSADNQRLEIEKAGYTVDYWFADTVSGKTSASQRPQFAALLAQIRKGETLLVSKLDRLGRDAQDVGATVKPRPCRPQWGKRIFLSQMMGSGHGLISESNTF
ncbi:MAG: recombinase family protein [Burkholderiaceae bacterium]|nr:recombinase family protein [Burkholderiaceae bacterium]